MFAPAYETMPRLSSCSLFSNPLSVAISSMTAGTAPILLSVSTHNTVREWALAPCVVASNTRSPAKLAIYLYAADYQARYTESYWL
jgi:hypothetical protein